ncbi:4a-hydroxytetrahydrobiopterin dehydratase [Nocardia inohanensis]|uniref:4a-hydroxytetrahydrobiopterin dehydratase n=1 Tax=Nocardia inohanensis TaxID=209246 RepID=UPI000836BE30|nr:4a-hydroxytetrahydrobiopterin dehydratase [Nocardia inohanensis]
MTRLTGKQIADAELDGWVHVPGGLQTRIRTKGFAGGLAIVNAIGAVAEELDHHPDLNLRYRFIDVRLSSHDVGGVTERDIRLARRVSAIAADAGAVLEPERVSRLELALDTPERAAVLPFWAAVFGLEPQSGPGPEDEISDPADVLPTLWFQQSGSAEPRQRWHPDIWIDPAQVRSRLNAALAAGGRLVSAEAAPSYWVLADPEGNRVCLCTWQDREPPQSA